MPVMKPVNMLPDWADPKQASVMDPLYKTLARKAVSAAGLDDPSSMIMQAAVPNVMPLVSIYPNKLDREAGTALFRTLLKKLPESWQQAGNEFADRYPRIAAHSRPMEVPNYTSGYTGRSVAAYAQTQDLPYTTALVGITPDGLDSAARSTQPVEAAKRIFKHEGTHVAQKLGNKNFDELYDEANKLTGYDRNAFERTAKFSEKAAPQTEAEQLAALDATINSASEQLRQRGISLDSGSGGWGPPNIRLRKWGAENIPENMIDAKTLPAGIQQKLDLIHTVNPREVGYYNKPPIPKPRVNAIDLLQNDVKEKTYNSLFPQPAHQVAGDKIKEILAKRAAKGWTPSEQD